jgi:hypothetical protein
MFLALREDFLRPSSLNWYGNCGGRRVRSRPISWKAGRKRSSAAEFKRYLQVAIGSCDDLQALAGDEPGEGYLSGSQCDQLSNRFNIVGAMLKSLWKQWQTYPK